MSDHPVTVASLNIRGRRLGNSRLADRYRAIGRFFEASTVDVVSFQEVVSYYHLWTLAAHMPSFRHVSRRRSPVGPSGGVATFSRLPLLPGRYVPFPFGASPVGIRAGLKGTLVTRLVEPALCVVNTHPLANMDGDWSATNRFYPVHREQLGVLARLVRGLDAPTVVCGDFNVPRESALHRAFLDSTGLVDAFGGRCPPTFHAEYLGPGRSPHTIDFILAGRSVSVVSAEVVLTENHLSDHVGLVASVRIRAPV